MELQEKEAQQDYNIQEMFWKNLQLKDVRCLLMLDLKPLGS